MKNNLLILLKVWLLLFFVYLIFRIFIYFFGEQRIYMLILCPILFNGYYVIKNGIKRSAENSNFYDRFMIHLNYFLDYLDRSRDDNVSLLEMESQIQMTYPQAYQVGSDIYRIIAQKTGIDLYRSERVYLVLHIQRLL